MKVDLVNKYLAFRERQKKEREELDNRGARLNRLRLVKAAIEEDEEDSLYQELYQLSEEREEEEEEEVKREEAEEGFKEIFEDPEQHEWALKNDPEYRVWFEERQEVLPEKKPSEKVTPPSKKEFDEEEQLRSDILQDTASALGLDEQQLLQEVEGEELKEETEELKELAKRKKVKPEDLVTFNREYKEYKRSRSPVSKKLALEAANGNEADAEELVRAFWGYVPATLLRDQYHIGVKKAGIGSLVLRTKDWKEQIRVFNEGADILLEQKDRYSPEDMTRIRKALSGLDDLKDVLEDSAELVVGALKQSDNNPNDSTFIETTKPLLARVQQIDRNLINLRRSLPTNADYGAELESLASNLSYVSTDLSDFLIEPGKEEYTSASSFLDWHDFYGKGDSKFDQLYKLIFDYAYLECAKRMIWDPRVLRAPGVEGDANSLLNAVLYGIGLQHVETKDESELAFTKYTDPDLEQYVYDREAYKERLNEIGSELAKERFRNSVESLRRHKTSINRNMSVLNKVHHHLNPTKQEMVCPECSASWWSFQAGQFQTNAFPNSSGELFNTSILPRAKGLTEDKYDQLKQVPSSIFNEWRFNPFRAPIGIFVRGEGEFCGGVYEGVDAEEIITKIQQCEQEAQDLKKQRQAQLDAIREMETEGITIPAELFKGPFDSQLIARLKAEFDGSKVARILLPNVSSVQAQSNAEKMKQALYTGEEVESFSYFEKEYVVTKEQLAKLKDELKGKLCFEPKRGQATSLADLVTKSVSDAILNLKHSLPKYSKQLGVSWWCPGCGRKYTEPVSQEVIEHSKKMFKTYEVICENELCTDRVHALDDVKYRKTQIPYSPPSQSLEYAPEEGGSALGATIAGPEELHPTVQIEKEEEEVERQEKTTKMVQELDTFGAEHEFEISPSLRGRVKKKVHFNNLGEVIFEVLGAGGNLETYDEILKAKTPELLKIAHKLGLLFPFAACASCGRIHPSPVKVGQTPRCVFVENTNLTKQMTMNEVLREFKRVEKEVPDYPSVHIPDFDFWKELWDKKFTTTASVPYIVRLAQSEEEEDLEEDFSDVGEFVDEDLASLLDVGEAKEEDVFEKLEEIGEEAKEEPEELGEIGMEALFDAEFGVEEEDTKEAKQVEEDSKQEEVSETPKETIAPTGLELLEQAEAVAEQEVKRPDDAFELQTLEEALLVLPLTTRKEVWGTEMLTFSSGQEVDEIPGDILEAVEKEFGVTNFVAIVDNPIEIVRTVFDEFMKQVKRVYKGSEVTN